MTSAEYNIYCDESCHLEHDGLGIMSIGGVWCPKSESRRISDIVRLIKDKHKARGELKWTKVSDAKVGFYKELLEYFFDTREIRFRCLVVTDKSKLNHSYFNQGSHDTFYYKMYFSMLRPILSPTNRYNIYLDIKDTRSKNKAQKLREVLCNDVYDFTRQMIVKIQHIHSRESQLIQLADLLIGAVSFRNRGLSASSAKSTIASELESKIGQSLTQSTSLYTEKFNLFIFTPSSNV
ncbi:MAG: hypothetical protein A2Z27_04035 [candidate division Zixibacteria bacterium RBG_16_50_21]|nr:MAG: hypothetical protein A2Z27_04035 [candidate division Zixibacteria bacterium RBG_16_50_21]